jgi:hypothetical protein
MVWVMVGFGFLIIGIAAQVYARRLSRYLIARRERLNKRRSAWWWEDPEAGRDVLWIRFRAGLSIAVGVFLILFGIGQPNTR